MFGHHTFADDRPGFFRRLVLALARLLDRAADRCADERAVMFRDREG